MMHWKQGSQHWNKGVNNLSNIEENLEKIQSAVWGKDVRKAIHDSIHDCYEDGKTGSTDLIARERITNLTNIKADRSELADADSALSTEIAVERARISNVIDSLNGEYGESELWTGSAYYKGQTITLSDSASNYEYLDFYCFERGNSFVQTISPSENYAVVRSYNIPNSGSEGTVVSSIQMDEISLSISGTTITLSDAVKWNWNGVNTSDAYKRPVVETDTENVLFIQKIVGRKILENTEVTDIRVGADGVTYPTAGDAVRGQVGELKEDLDSKLYGIGIETTRIENAYINNVGVIATSTFWDVYAVKIPKGEIIKSIIVSPESEQVIFGWYDSKPVLNSIALDNIRHTSGAGNYSSYNQTPVVNTEWVAVRTAKGYTPTVVPVYTEIGNDLNMIIGIEEYSDATNSHNGITYTWIDKTYTKIEGTASADSFYNIFHSTIKLLGDLKEKEKFFLQFSSQNTHIIIKLIFYNSSGTIIKRQDVATSSDVEIPEGAVGMTMRYYIYKGFSANDIVYMPIAFKYQVRNIATSLLKGSAKYISFIDDDTTNDTYVSRYYNACRHNGVRGSYAVVTKHYLDGQNDINLLKTAMYNGFNMCLHCNLQTADLRPDNPNTFNEESAMENYTNAINAFRTLGLVNPQNIWIIPYGTKNAKTQEMGKNLGFEIAFTTDGNTYNKPYDNNRYTMHRTGLSSSGDVTDDQDASELGTMARCKARVDELSEDSNGGWLVITTHFNEWDDMTYDTTLDENGFEIGYSRFNEFVQYALSKGLTPISMAEGASIFKPILDRNSTID